MMTKKTLKIKVPDKGTVSGILELPTKPSALLVLAHGAGAGMNHPTMMALSRALVAQGIGVLRYQFPYMEQGQKRPDSPKTAVATIESVVKIAEKLSRLPLFAGGKSFGGRMTTTAASLEKLPGVRGILCFGFPLHSPAKPGIERSAHLSAVSVPMLWFQGTRDSLAELSLVKKVVSKHKRLLTVHVIKGGDHSFAVPKSSGRTPKEVMDEIATSSREWIANLL